MISYEKSKTAIECAENEARATAARYDEKTRHLIVELRSGCTLIVPVDLIQELHGASDAELAEITVWPFGYALEWERVNGGITVAGLVAGRFGNHHWMSDLSRKADEAKGVPNADLTVREMARRGSAAKTPRKQAAARRNGSKGEPPAKLTAVKRRVKV